MKLGLDNNDSFMSDINITPFVDVLLVLLVLFIVTLPVVIENLNVNLPKTASGSHTEIAKPVYIAIDKNGEIAYENNKVSEEELINALATVDKQNSTIVIQADQVNKYGNVIELLGKLKSLGFVKVGLSVENNVKP